jgi:hypothetical protein
MRSMLVAAVLTALGLTSRAAAQITAFWQRATITPAAIAEVPALANMQSWDLLATTSGNWLSARMAARLPAGVTFYKHPLGGLTRPDPSMFNSSPALQFTTYASAANDTGTNHTTLVLGSFLFNADPASIGDATSPLPGVFDMMWGNSPPTAPPGTYQIARLTFPQGVLPEVIGLSATTQLNPEADALIPQIPEPNLVSLLGAIALVLLRRRPMGQ